MQVFESKTTKQTRLQRRFAYLSLFSLVLAFISILYVVLSFLSSAMIDMKLPSSEEFSKLTKKKVVDPIDDVVIYAKESKVVVFIGIMTRRGAGGFHRREAMRCTQDFPATRSERHKMREDYGIEIKFVVGESNFSDSKLLVEEEGEKTTDIESRLHSEEEKYGDDVFLKIGNDVENRIPLQDDYKHLPLKTYLYFKTVLKLFPHVKYIAKVDDDVLLLPIHLRLAIQDYDEFGSDYISCMKRGKVLTENRYKWYEPQHELLGEQYFVHAWGPAYVLSARIVKTFTAIDIHDLRAFANEDVTIGSWMLAFSALHFDDRRMCHTECSNNTIAVYDIPKSGFLDPIKSFADASLNPKCSSMYYYDIGGNGTIPLSKRLPLQVTKINPHSAFFPNEHSLGDLVR